MIDDIISDEPMLPTPLESLDIISHAENTQKKHSRSGVEYLRWTKEEENKLVQIVAMNQGKNWIDIAKLVGNGRTGKACNHKYQDMRKIELKNAVNSSDSNNANSNHNDTTNLATNDGEIQDGSNGMNMMNMTNGIALPGETKNMNGEISSIPMPLLSNNNGEMMGVPELHNLQLIVSRVLWSVDEDKLLIQFISEYTTAQHFPWAKLFIAGRSRKACSNRWDYLLKNKLVPEALLEAIQMKRALRQDEDYCDAIGVDERSGANVVVRANK